ncbi:MAG: ABC-F family ATP-binding cassette domain-containing protein [bacterium]|nr:ABC-F family ATP-binding cassette domain-containing protein [bacterium]
MTLLTTKNLSKFYGGDEVFSGITVEVPQKARIALVGPNGAGKTTLLNLLISHDQPTEGEIFISKSTRIGFLPQRPELAGQHTLWEEQIRAFEGLRALEAQLHQLTDDLADPAKHDQALAAYGQVQEQFEHAGGYTYETRIRMVLQGVGFKESDFEMPLPRLSGGQKTRAMLARLLLEAPDLLVLDEPTNHLDIEAVEWLENFLHDFPGAVLAVSHDRYFMDAFASTIWELEWGNLETYRGNYSHYVHQRAERHERLEKEYEAQQEFIAKEMDYIRKHMGSRWTAQAKGRLKKLETLKRRGKIIAKPRAQRQEMNLRIQAAVRSGDKVLMAKELAVGYPDAEKPLFRIHDITLYRGETAALIGPNGVGKSTFLKTVIGQLAPLSGETRLGAGVRVGYFAQAHELLSPNNTLIDEVTAVKPMPISEARNLLAQFLFTGDDVFRTVGTLSGGERGRLALAKLQLDGANLLLLDEPTNHLDIDSQEVLEEALASFSGTVLLVSHDRYLIDALATQIWAASPGRLDIFKGTYREFLAARQAAAQPAANGAAAKTNGTAQNGGRGTTNGTAAKDSAANNGAKKHGLNPFQLKKRVAEVEEQIMALETRLEELIAAIEAASTGGEAKKVSDLGAEYTQAEADLQALMDTWAVLVE